MPVLWDNFRLAVAAKRSRNRRPSATVQTLRATSLRGKLRAIAAGIRQPVSSVADRSASPAPMFVSQAAPFQFAPQTLATNYREMMESRSAPDRSSSAAKLLISATELGALISKRCGNACIFTCSSSHSLRELPLLSRRNVPASISFYLFVTTITAGFSARVFSQCVLPAK